MHPQWQAAERQRRAHLARVRAELEAAMERAGPSWMRDAAVRCLEDLDRLAAAPSMDGFSYRNLSGQAEMLIGVLAGHTYDQHRRG